MAQTPHEYFKVLHTRKRESRVYKKHQLIGLEIAEALHDRTHKSLYMKLAKEGSPEKLLALAKEVAERKNIKKKGAYFMACLTRTKKTARQRGNG